MISADRSNTTGPIIDINILKSGFFKYYNCLSEDEFEPIKIVLCSSLIEQKDELLEKIVLIYGTKLVIIKSINGNISKYKLDYNDINFIVHGGLPNSNCLTIDYKSDLKEHIFYDTKSFDLVSELVNDLRKKLLNDTCIEERDDYSDFFFSDLEENKYPGALIAKASVLDKDSILCSLKQKKVYTHLGLVFRKSITQTHFTVVCKKEIVVFQEKVNSRVNHTFLGDLIHIPLRSVKNVSLEATGKGMIMKYVFNTDKRLELFYDNERTDLLLKIMSYINGMITR